MARSKLTLQDVARAAVDQNGGKGGRALQRLAESKGLTLSFTTVDRILAGKYESRPQRQTIEALAVLADMPIETVYEAAGVPLPMAPLADQLPEGSDQLTVDQRRVVLDVIRGFIRDNRRIGDLEDDLALAPPHPAEVERLARELDVRQLSDDALDELVSKLALVELDADARRAVHLFWADAYSEYRQRGFGGPDVHERPAAGVPVEGDAQPDGVTPSAVGERGARPWDTDEYALAAKRGRNRGREAREQQDRAAEEGGA